MSAITLSNRRIAVFEDNERKRERLCGLVKLCHGIAVPVAGHAPQIEALPDFYASEKIELLVCDHRLFEHGDYASYFGAQAVAESYHLGVGGIVLTAYEKNDADDSLRRSRRWIPALVHSTELTTVSLQTALLQADLEVREHQISKERTPHRTIMTVMRVEERNTSKIVKVMMSQWDSEHEVGFPLDLIPTKLRVAAKPGNLLIAQVNIDAARQEDLFFDKFELPNPDALKKAKSILSHS